MEALRIKGQVGENGLIIGINQLKKFKNKKVEIIILPDEGDGYKVNNKKRFFDAIGKIDIDESVVTKSREVSKL